MLNDEKVEKSLCGSTPKEKAQIIKWASYSNGDLSTELCNAIFPLVGYQPYNKKQVDSAMETLEKGAQIYENRLKEYTFLVGERITLADIISVALWSLYFSVLTGEESRAKHPYLVRWCSTLVASPYCKESYGHFKYAEKALEPPKKQKAEKPKKEAAKPAKKAEKPAESEEPAPEKKAKHPLEALGKSTFVLDEWKRQYSNEDTRPVALPWFWEHYNPEEYSIWKVDYKYNDELTMTFMSNNLVGGFFNRLSASTKFVFGCLVVYGENNNNGIIGAIMVRGQDCVPAFNVAPDWESYQFTKLDTSNEEDKEFINNMWAWDKPVIVNGEPREIADGKVLK